MVTPDRQIRILDFGIGSLLAETEGESLVDTMSTANSVASGLDCASPESIMDPTNLTPLGDQYSLGCVLYYCLSGRYPFPDGTAAEKMMAHQFKQPTPIRELVPDLPDPLADLVERLMQKSPEARYGSTAEVVEALRPFARATSSAAAGAARAPAARVAATPAARNSPVANGKTQTAEASPPVERKASPAGARPEPPAAAPIPARSAPVQVPTRQSLRASAPASPSRPQAAAAPPAPAPSQRPTTKSPPKEKPAPAASSWEEPPLSWEERLGPIGIALCAIVVCAVAWLLTWKLF